MTTVLAPLLHHVHHGTHHHGQGGVTGPGQIAFFLKHFCGKETPACICGSALLGDFP